MIDKEQEKRNHYNMEIDKIYLGNCIEIIGKFISRQNYYQK